MADSILNLILRATKTGTGAADASRELKTLDQQIKTIHQSAVQITRSYYDMAQSLKGNSSIANVTQNALKGLNQELSAGRLNTDQYAKATEAALLQSKQISPASLQASKSIGQLNLDYTAGKINAQQYASGLQNVQKELDSSRGFMEKYGAALKGLAIAGVLALGAAFVDVVHTAGQFETAMTRITALTDTSKAEIGGMTRAVLDMSKEVGKSPKELAEGLYFIASSGFAGAQGLQVLEAAAKASAAGLGETKTVADAVTSALNAYKAPVQEATHYTDLLIQIVKEGKGEPEAFAASLGRILPIASAAGVSFEQVGASMATMTRVGLSAEESATALRGVLGALVAPGKQATEALLSLGLSTDQLRAMIKDRGLLDTLQELMQRTHGNVETLDLIIPNVRALTGVLATAGSQSEEYTKILEGMNHAAGATDKAFATMADTFEFKLKKAEASFDSLKITVGNKVLPVVGQFFDTMGKGIDTLDLLTTGTQRIEDAFTGARENITATAKTFDEYQSAVLATAVAAHKLTQEQVDQYLETGKVTNGYQVAADGAAYLGDHLGLLSEQAFKLAQAQKDNAGIYDESDRAARRAAAGLDENTAAAEDNADATERSKAAQKALKDEFEALKFVMAGAVGKEMTDFNDKQSELKDKAAEVKAELDKLIASDGQLVTSHSAVSMTANERIAAETKLAAVQEDLTAKQHKKNETDLEFDARMASLAVKADKLTDKLGKNSGALGANAQATIDNSKKIGELKKKYEEITGQIEDTTLEHEDSTRRILFDMAAQQLGMDGLTANEVQALTALATQWGLMDQATATATQNVLNATLGLSQDQNIGNFQSKMSAALRTVQTDAGDSARTVVMLKDDIDKLHDKTIRITSIFTEHHVSDKGGGRTTPLAGGAQFGGAIPALQPTLVGEGGPELFFPASRGFVMDNADSMRLIRAMETLAAVLGTAAPGRRAGNTFNMTVNTGTAPAAITRDFAMMQALAG